MKDESREIFIKAGTEIAILSQKIATAVTANAPDEELHDLREKRKYWEQEQQRIMFEWDSFCKTCNTRKDCEGGSK